MEPDVDDLSPEKLRRLARERLSQMRVRWMNVELIDLAADNLPGRQQARSEHQERG